LKCRILAYLSTNLTLEIELDASKFTANYNEFPHLRGQAENADPQCVQQLGICSLDPERLV